MLREISYKVGTFMTNINRKLSMASFGAALSVLAFQVAANAGTPTPIQCPDGSFVIPPDVCPAVKVPESSPAPALMLLGAGCAVSLGWKRIQEAKANKTKEN